MIHHLDLPDQAIGRLTAQLWQLLDPTFGRQSSASAPESSPSPWPQGPTNGAVALSGAEVEGVVRQILAALPSQPGLRRSTLAALLSPPHRCLAEALLAWFARAELLGPPHDPSQPWRRDRMIMASDLAIWQKQLQKTPLKAEKPTTPEECSK